MAQIWKWRMPNGDVVTPGDWTGAEPLFSVVEFPEGQLPTRTTAFSYGKGASSVPGSIGPRPANEADTNLEGEGGRLPENEEVIAYNLAIEVFTIGGPGNNAADIWPQSDPPEVSLLNMLRFQRDVLIKFRIAAVDKVYIQAPVSYFPASTGVIGWNSGARTELSDAQEGFVSANNGSPNADDIRIFATPLRIRGGETFGIDYVAGPGLITDLNVSLRNAAGTITVQGRLRTRTYIDGYRRRPVA